MHKHYKIKNVNNIKIVYPKHILNLIRKDQKRRTKLEKILNSPSDAIMLTTTIYELKSEATIRI